jgi:hypothetical protein
MEVLSMHPDVACVAIWGDDFCDWEHNLTAEDNFKRKFGGAGTFDFVVAQQIPGANAHDDRANALLAALGMPVGIIFHDCHIKPEQFGCDEVMRLVKPVFAIFPNHYEMALCCLLEADRSVLTGPVRFAINTMRFTGVVSPSGSNDCRDIDIVALGPDPPVQLRRQVAQHLGREVALLGGNIDRNATYPQILARSKVFLAGSAALEQQLGEAACSGALVVAELSIYAPPAFRDMIVPIESNAGDEALGETVAWWLANDAARLLRTHRAQTICREQFSARRFADVLLDAFEDSEGKKFGVILQPSRLHPGRLHEAADSHIREETEQYIWSVAVILIGAGWATSCVAWSLRACFLRPPLFWGFH